MCSLSEAEMTKNRTKKNQYCIEQLDINAEHILTVSYSVRESAGRGNNSLSYNNGVLD